MNATQLLVSLARAVAPLESDGAQLSIALDVDAVVQAIAPIAPQETLGGVASLLGECAAGRVALASALSRLRRLAAALDETAAGTGEGRRLVAELDAHAQAIAALRSAGNGAERSLRQAAVSLAASPLARVVREWRLSATPDSPETIIAHRPPGATAPLDVSLRGRSYVERRVAVRYEGAPFPHILLTAPSQSVRDAAPQRREAWPQRPTADYDLAILTEQERHKGAAATRLLPGRVIARGETLTITLDSPAGHALLSTEILDETGRPLVRVLRWPPIPV